MERPPLKVRARTAVAAILTALGPWARENAHALQGAIATIAIGAGVAIWLHVAAGLVVSGALLYADYAVGAWRKPE